MFNTRLYFETSEDALNCYQQMMSDRCSYLYSMVSLQGDVITITFADYISNNRAGVMIKLNCGVTEHVFTIQYDVHKLLFYVND